MMIFVLSDLSFGNFWPFRMSEQIKTKVLGGFCAVFAGGQNIMRYLRYAKDDGRFLRAGAADPPTWPPAEAGPAGEVERLLLLPF